MQEIKGLTSLRGIAAMAVVMQHFSATAQLHALGPIPSLVPHGYLAVDLFFVLSGYVMSYTYLDSFRRLGAAAYAPFLFKRVIRLFPLNVVVTLVIFALGHLTWIADQWISPAARQADGWDLLINLLMLQGFGVGRNLNGPSWSVSAEFIAYALFPVLVIVLFSRGRRLATLAAGLAVAGILTVALNHPKLALTAEGPVSGALRCLSGFVFGMLVYRVCQNPRWLRVLEAERTAWFACAATLLMLATRIDPLVALMFPLLVAVAATNSGRFAKLLNWQPWYFLGEISFSLYLVHDMFRPIALGLLRYVHPAQMGTAPSMLFAAVASLCVIPVAWICYRSIEMPARHHLRKWFS